jgi:hypothetical protein
MVALLVVLVALAANVLVILANFARGPFWDFQPVHAAVVAAAQGLDPYDLKTLSAINPLVAFPYLYPPHLLWLLKPLALLSYPAAALVYGLVTLLAAAYVYLEQARLFGLRPRATSDIALFLLALGSAALVTVSAGNLAVLLYAFLALGLGGIARNRPLPFYAAVLLAGVVKYYYFWFLVLPLAIDFRRHLPGVLCVTIVAALVYGASLQIDPKLFESFVRSSADTLNKTRDYGEGFVSLPLVAIDELAARTSVTVPRIVAYVFYAACVGLLAIIGWMIARAYRAEDDAERRHVLLALLWIVVVIALPRLKIYDLFAAIVPLLVVVRRSFFERRVEVNAGWLLLLVILAPATFPYSRHIMPLLGQHWLLLVVMSCWLWATFLILGEPRVREDQLAANHRADVQVSGPA